MLIVFAFDAVISIAYGNRDGGAVDNRDGVRGRASCRLLRRLLRCKISSCYRTHYMEASPGPTEAIYVQGFNEG